MCFLPVNLLQLKNLQLLKMITIGEFIRKKRLEAHLTLDDLENKTKIKKDFLKAIEKENWKSLPEYPVLRGFVKSIAAALDIEKDKAVAFLRRDYPPTEISINPKKTEVKERFRWSP